MHGIGVRGGREKLNVFGNEGYRMGASGKPGGGAILGQLSFFPEPDFRDNRQPEASGGVWRGDHFT